MKIEESILLWLENNRDYAIALLPLFAFAEACIGVGLFVSGVFLLVVSATLLNNGIAGLETIIPLAFCGALLGDHAGYYLGRIVGPGLHRFKLVRKYQAAIARSESLILRYGGAAIFIGRFIPAIRSVVPALIGISGFDRLKFSLIDALACLCWALALAAILLGIDGYL